MIALYLHPPVDREPDVLLDSPAIVAWWEQERWPGASVLVRVDQLQPLVEDAAVRAALDKLEGFTMVVMERRG